MIKGKKILKILAGLYVVISLPFGPPYPMWHYEIDVAKSTCQLGDGKACESAPGIGLVPGALKTDYGTIFFGLHRSIRYPVVALSVPFTLRINDHDVVSRWGEMAASNIDYMIGEEMSFSEESGARFEFTGQYPPTYNCSTEAIRKNDFDKRTFYISPILMDRPRLKGIILLHNKNTNAMVPLTFNITWRPVLRFETMTRGLIVFPSV